MVDGKRSEHGPKTYNDFYWAEYDEPHEERKKALLKKYGDQIRPLMGYEPITKYIATCVVIAQLASGVLVKDLPWGWWCLYAYVIGGTLAHNTFLAIHEVSHHLGFKKIAHNDYFMMFMNTAIGIPYSMMFKVYHYEHHRYQGWEGVDTDLPTLVEALLFRTMIGKLIFATFQILFYALRPCIVRAQKITPQVLMNWAVVLTFNTWYIGTFGWMPYFYLIVSVFFAGSLNPMAGHFIAEHYIFDPKGVQETYSYYGWMNIFGYNVGYHNEHHDFPNIPWTRLHKLRQIAPEFYDTLIPCPSWGMAVVWFILDPRVSIWCRMKRERGAGRRQGALHSTLKPKGDF